MLKRLTGKKNHSYKGLRDRAAYIRECQLCTVACDNVHEVLYFISASDNYERLY